MQIKFNKDGKMICDKNDPDLPTLFTQQALLLIDFQEGVHDSNGILPLRNPPELIENVQKLVPVFRRTGPIIWITTQYKGCRTVNDGSDTCESIITDKEVAALKSGTEKLSVMHARKSRHIPKLVNRRTLNSVQGPAFQITASMDLEADDDSSQEDPEADEAWLSVGATNRSPRHKLLDQQTAIIESLVKVVAPHDITFKKSHYSPFRSENFLETLRRNLITELFICGALSNTSVYATALDAASHGFAITLVDDCLGWRGEERHEQSLASLDVTTGCDILSSGEVIASLQSQRPQSHGRR